MQYPLKPIGKEIQTRFEFVPGFRQQKLGQTDILEASKHEESFHLEPAPQ